MLTRHYAPKNGKNVEASLSLPSPASEAKESEWQVVLKLTGLESPFEQSIFGVDSIQALEMAIMILQTLEEKELLELPED